MGLFFLEYLHQKLPSTDEGFRGGRLKQFALNWKEFTSDKGILESIKGCIIEFTETPCQISTASTSCRHPHVLMEGINSKQYGPFIRQWLDVSSQRNNYNQGHAFWEL